MALTPADVFDLCAKIADDMAKDCWDAHAQFGTGREAFQYEAVSEAIRRAALTQQGDRGE
jgi:hypothetical protein